MPKRWPWVVLVVAVILAAVVTYLSRPRNYLTLHVHLREGQPAEAVLDASRVRADAPVLAAAFDEARESEVNLIRELAEVEQACDVLEPEVRSCSGFFEFEGKTYQTILIAI